jgi:hypothetical protein
MLFLCDFFAPLRATAVFPMEAAGIEPASEESKTATSTGLSGVLDVGAPVSHRRDSGAPSPLGLSHPLRAQGCGIRSRYVIPDPTGEARTTLAALSSQS